MRHAAAPSRCAATVGTISADGGIRPQSSAIATLRTPGAAAPPPSAMKRTKCSAGSRASADTAPSSRQRQRDDQALRLVRSRDRQADGLPGFDAKPAQHRRRCVDQPVEAAIRHRGPVGADQRDGRGVDPCEAPDRLGDIHPGSAMERNPRNATPAASVPRFAPASKPSQHPRDDAAGGQQRQRGRLRQRAGHCQGAADGVKRGREV